MNHPNDQQLPRISVVVPIRNEEAFIEQTLAYLLQQDYPQDKTEILVVDGESDDRTPEIVRGIADRDNRVRYLRNPRRLSSSARNIGAYAASGDIVTFVDGHTYIDNNQLLASIAQTMRERDVSVLSRPQFLEPPDNNTFQQAVALARRSIIGHGLDSTIYSDEDKYVNPASSGASYRKELFEQVGYFDERFDAAEDYEFNYRVAVAGLRSYTSMRLAVYYYPRKTLGGLFRQMRRYGIGRMRLARKHPKTLGLGTLIPVVFLLGLPILVAFSMILPWVPLLLAGAYGLYALLIAIVSAFIGARRGWRFFAKLLLIYPVIHAGLGWGFIEEFWRTIRGRGLDLNAPAHPSVPTSGVARS